MAIRFNVRTGKIEDDAAIVGPWSEKNRQTKKPANPEKKDENLLGLSPATRRHIALLKGASENLYKGFGIAKQGRFDPYAPRQQSNQVEEATPPQAEDYAKQQEERRSQFIRKKETKKVGDYSYDVYEAQPYRDDKGNLNPIYNTSKWSDALAGVNVAMKATGGGGDPLYRLGTVIGGLLGGLTTGNFAGSQNYAAAQKMAEEETAKSMLQTENEIKIKNTADLMTQRAEREARKADMDALKEIAATSNIIGDRITANQRLYGMTSDADQKKVLAKKIIADLQNRANPKLNKTEMDITDDEYRSYDETSFLLLGKEVYRNQFGHVYNRTTDGRLVSVVDPATGKPFIDFTSAKAMKEEARRQNKNLSDEQFDKIFERTRILSNSLNMRIGGSAAAQAAVARKILDTLLDQAKTGSPKYIPGSEIGFGGGEWTVEELEGRASTTPQQTAAPAQSSVPRTRTITLSDKEYQIEEQSFGKAVEVMENTSPPRKVILPKDTTVLRLTQLNDTNLIKGLDKTYGQHKLPSIYLDPPLNPKTKTRPFPGFKILGIYNPNAKKYDWVLVEQPEEK